VEDIKTSKFDYDPAKYYWFNYDEIIKKFFVDSSNKITFEQGITLETLLKDIGKWKDCEVIVNTTQYDIFGAKISILSPNSKILKQFDNQFDKEYEKLRKSGKIAEEDSSDYGQTLDDLCKELQTEKENTTLSLSNRSSIAFIFEYMGKKALLLGDAHPAIVVESLRELGYSQENKLTVDCVKLAHHGSIKNTSFKLLAMIDCQQFLISTNGIKDNLPNKKTFAKILCHPQRDRSKTIYFLFNYKEEKFKNMFTEADKKKYNFECRLENTPYGYLVEL
jgi:hypothetical protein